MRTGERLLLIALGCSFAAIWVIPMLAPAFGWPIAVIVTAAAAASALLYGHRKARKPRR